MPLTDTLARNAKPAAKTVRMFDRDGLYLEVSPRGGKWWRLKYRYAGKEKRVSLGVFPEVNLKKARARTIEARQLLDAGVQQLARLDRARAGLLQVDFRKHAERHAFFLAGVAIFEAPPLAAARRDLEIQAVAVEHPDGF